MKRLWSKFGQVFLAMLAQTSFMLACWAYQAGWLAPYCFESCFALRTVVAFEACHGVTSIILYASEHRAAYRTCVR
eukprot:3226418-Pyramimonas_sp.AAC.1